MLFLANLAKAAVAAATATLTFSSTRNMLQTYTTVAPDRPPVLPAPSAAEAVTFLKSCPRKEFLEIFLASSETPDPSEIEGTWDGLLLDNNGLVMTKVAGFFTHSLFGEGGHWESKAFMGSGRGINRFTSKESSPALIEKHAFDYKVEPSALSTDLEAIVLRYSNHVSGVRGLLWKSMKDELRLVRCENGDCVLLGIGCMGWSGGILNGTPFCLYRRL